MARKRKKKGLKVKFLIGFILVALGVCVYLFYVPYSFLDKINYDLKGSITYYDIYGIHMNFEGSFTLDEGYSNPKLVLANGFKEEVISWDLVKDGNVYNFKTSDYINDGINLEKLDVGSFHLLIKAENSRESVYFPLVNETDYDDLEYYTLSPNNKKIDITWDSYKGHELLGFYIKSSKLPDDVYDITIDPGHDGKDSGMIVCSDGSVPNSLGNCLSGTSYKEADLNFSVALEVKKELEDLGYKVKLTRDSKDATIKTYGKMGSATTANATKSKFNLALHHNSTNVAGGMSEVYGLEVYVAGDSKLDLARSFTENITKYGKTSASTKKEFKVENGIYQRFSDDGITPYYYMIREVGGIATHAYVDGSNTKYDENPYYNSNNTAEGYLLELGYIDNVSELKNILDNPHGYAKGVALGIHEYLKEA